MNRRIVKKLIKRYRIRKYCNYKQFMKRINTLKSQLLKVPPTYDFYNRASDKPILFKTADDTYIVQLYTRKPTEIECRQFLIKRLKSMYILSSNMSQQQYRSVKGQIRRGYIDFGIKFMANYVERHFNEVSSCYSRDYFHKSLDDYKNSDIHEVQVTKKIGTPMRSEVIDLQLGQLNLED